MDAADRLLKPLRARFYLNMARISSLVRLVHPVKQAGAMPSIDSVGADVSRAIVVFLHATFEDLLRTTARERLAAADPDHLNDIPLMGSKGRRAQKFSLGALTEHRGKTIDELLQQSVDEYLNGRSFSSCRDVTTILEAMSLEPHLFWFLFADLERMMKRRHRIVHEADLPDPEDIVAPPWTFSDPMSSVSGCSR